MFAGERISEAKMEGIEVESNPQQRVKLQRAVMAASAIVVMGAVAAAVLGQEETAPAAAGQMTIGQTATSTTAPAAMATSFASPTMKAARPNGFG
jgi:ribosomal protein S8E